MLLPQLMVVTVLLLQVMVCWLPVDTILVLQMKVLLSGQRQVTSVAEPSTTGGGGAAVMGATLLALLLHLDRQAGDVHGPSDCLGREQDRFKDLKIRHKPCT